MDCELQASPGLSHSDLEPTRLQTVWTTNPRATRSGQLSGASGAALAALTGRSRDLASLARSCAEAHAFPGLWHPGRSGSAAGSVWQDSAPLTTRISGAEYPGGGSYAGQPEPPFAVKHWGGVLSRTSLVPVRVSVPPSIKTPPVSKESFAVTRESSRVTCDCAS